MLTVLLWGMTETIVDFGSKPNVVSVIEMDEDIYILMQINLISLKSTG